MKPDLKKLLGVATIFYVVLILMLWLYVFVQPFQLVSTTSIDSTYQGYQYNMTQQDSGIGGLPPYPTEVDTINGESINSDTTVENEPIHPRKRKR